MHNICFLKTVAPEPIMAILHCANIWKMLCIAQLCLEALPATATGCVQTQVTEPKELQQCRFSKVLYFSVWCCSQCQEANLWWIQGIKYVGAYFSTGSAEIYNLSEWLCEVDKIISVKIKEDMQICSSRSLHRRCSNYSHWLWMPEKYWKYDIHRGTNQ